MVMAYTEQGPVARAAMTYSQSEDPDSPHFSDQTLLYAQETLRDVRFTEEQISSDPSLQTLQITLEAGSD